MNEKFSSEIKAGYDCKGDFVVLGGAVLDGESQKDTFVKISLKTLNRHGLIAGATGTGKTKTMQGFVESLSMKGIPCLLMDVKGDLSGLGAPGIKNDKIEERHKTLGIPWESKNFTVEFLTISSEK